MATAELSEFVHILSSAPSQHHLSGFESGQLVNWSTGSVASYEIVCATAHKAPMSAYFELEAQPDERIEYTAKLDIANMKRTPKFMLIRG